MPTFDSDLSRSTADPENELMSCRCSLAPPPGPLAEPRLSKASAPRSAPAKPALTQRKAPWPARDRRRMGPGSSVFFPFPFLPDSWNVFAHGGKNAKSREKRPGTSPSLSALGYGAGRHGGPRQHRYPGKSEEPLINCSG